MPLGSTSNLKSTLLHNFRTRSYLPRGSSTILYPRRFLHTPRMPRLTGKALADDIANTVLEDSEPERQAEEAIRKGQQRQPRDQENMDKKVKSEVSDEVIVVADSERNSSALHSVPKFAESIVIEISDTTTSTLEGIAPPENGLRHLISSQSSEQEIQHLLVQSPQSDQANLIFVDPDNAPIDLTACISSSTEQELVAPKLDIARFAFKKKAGSSIIPKPGQALSRQFSNTSTSEEIPPAAKSLKATKSAVPLPSFASSFATSQLKGLSKCFVCNLAWTARKTVPVKLSHIKSCARKNGWNEETIIVRMTKEIGHISTTTSTDSMQNWKKSKDKGKGVADQAHKTFLEDVVNDAAPKKRRKKVRDVEVVTVLNPQDAHAAIVERAKALLGPPVPPSGSVQDEVVSYPTTQIFAPSKLGPSGPRAGVLGLGMLEDQTARLPSGSTMDPEYKVIQTGSSELPPSTQTFRPSALAGKSAKRSVLYGGEDDNGKRLGKNDSAGMLPPTQGFRQSALATKFGESKQSLLDMDGIHTSTFLPQVDNRNADQMQVRPSKSLKSTTKPLLAATRPRTFNNAGVPSTSSSLNDDRFSLPVTSQKRLVDLDSHLAGIRTGSQDGKVQVVPYPIVSSEPFLEQIPQTIEMNRAGYESVVWSVPRGKKKAWSGSLSSSSSGARPRSKSRSGSRSRKSSGRRKSRRTCRNQRTPEEECGDNYFSDTLDQALYRIIKDDKVLYERILRYEPIHFDVFLKLAGIQELDCRGFKLKLRAFLDKQAINFYGDSALISNRRRYK